MYRKEGNGKEGIIYVNVTYSTIYHTDYTQRYHRRYPMATQIISSYNIIADGEYNIKSHI